MAKNTDYRFWEKTIYKDTRGRTIIIMRIDNFFGKQHEFEILIMPDFVIKVVTYDDMMHNISNNLMLEQEPTKEINDSVWQQRKLDEVVLNEARKNLPPLVTTGKVKKTVKEVEEINNM